MIINNNIIFTHKIHVHYHWRSRKSIPIWRSSIYLIYIIYFNYICFINVCQTRASVFPEDWMVAPPDCFGRTVSTAAWSAQGQPQFLVRQTHKVVGPPVKRRDQRRGASQSLVRNTHEAVGPPAKRSRPPQGSGGLAGPDSLAARPSNLRETHWPETGLHI